MKKKNLFLCTLMCIGGISTAFSAPTLSDIKNDCNSTEGYSWDDGTNECLVSRICADGTREQQDNHCNKLLKRVQVQSETDAQRLVNRYLTLHNYTSENCEVYQFMSGDPTIGLQDVVRCKTTNGIMEFEFDDVSESSDNISRISFAVALCLVYGGEPYLDDIWLNKSLYESLTNEPSSVFSDQRIDCRNITNMSICQEMYGTQGVYSQERKACSLPKGFVRL